MPVILAVYFLVPSVESRSSDAKVFRELVPKKVRVFRSAVSKRLSELPPAAASKTPRSSKMGRAEGQAREIKNGAPFRKQVDSFVPDSAAPTSAIGGSPLPDAEVSFEGLNSNDNAAAYGFRAIPPDTIGDVGPNHYVQAVNLLFRVYSKTGTPLTPPLKMSSLFAPLGTPCSTRDDGDPNVVYDELADRWILSQFCKNAPPFRQMIAISMTGDPAGAYYIYEFVMPNVKLNDYAKLAAWHDAYYMSTDEFFGGDYAGSGAFAFEREKLLVGDPTASYIYFDLASPTTLRIGGILPVDHDGKRPPAAATPGLFLGYTANEYGEPFDGLRIFEFHTDFENPSNSVFAEAGGSPIATIAFDPTSDSGRDDIKQPPPGEDLDSQSDRLMYRAAYRNLGATESIVVAQTIRIPNSSGIYRAGTRVHQIKRDQGGSFEIGRQLTSGDPDTSRFMGAAAQDHIGNIAFGYSVSNEEKMPAIVYTGQATTDQPDSIRPERPLVEGTGVQTAFGFRWGDYSGMSADPADGCSFWITNEYYSLESQQESQFGWLTKIGKFRFPECTDETSGTITVNVVNDQTSAPIQNAKAELAPNSATGSYLRFSKADGNFDAFGVLFGGYTLEVSAPGYRTEDYALESNATNPNQTVNARLVPVPVITGGISELTLEGCVTNQTAEPGETVTASIPLRNTGSLDSSSISAVLLDGNGITSAETPVSYGALPAGGAAVAREFEFSINPGVSCGDVLELRFAVSDGTTDLGITIVSLQTGRLRVVFAENFDALEIPALPKGWTTSFEGVRENWTTTNERAFSGKNSAFSPDPRTIGVNELVSPPISISSQHARLSFKNWYELETTFLRNRVYDGAVLEIQIDDGDWQDILDAGGEFVSGGYNDGFIDGCCSNPLVGRRAWSGRSGIDTQPVFIDSIVDLPPAVAGHSVRFRWRVATDNGTFREGQYIDDVVVTDGYGCECKSAATNRAPFDFDGDGQTDRGLFAPVDVSESPDFRIIRSSDNQESSISWGSSGDRAVNADFDGDGAFDIAVYRPSSGTWFIFQSSDGMIRIFNFGLADDIPVPGDFDGDGRADAAIFRPSDGNWWVLKSTDQSAIAVKFGLAGDIPVQGDYDGDSQMDFAVYRPTEGTWYTLSSSTLQFSVLRFGLAGDVPVPGDFDGDNRNDLALFRPSDRIWYLLKTTGGFSATQFGLATDQPLQADFDGDGKHDIAVYRADDGNWYWIASDSGSIGVSGTPTGAGIPIPSIYVGDNAAQQALR
ncbi:MAG: hypothetical protein R2684_14005 [Pyrinomonadaceae bacterium]